MRAVPAEGGWNPSSVWSSVVLPAPFGPEEADAPAGEGGVQPLEDRTPPELDLQALELDDGCGFGHVVLQGPSED